MVFLLTFGDGHTVIEEDGGLNSPALAIMEAEAKAREEFPRPPGNYRSNRRGWNLSKKQTRVVSVQKLPTPTEGV